MGLLPLLLHVRGTRVWGWGGWFLKGPSAWLYRHAVSRVDDDRSLCLDRSGQKKACLCSTVSHSMVLYLLHTRMMITLFIEECSDIFMCVRRIIVYESDVFQISRLINCQLEAHNVGSSRGKHPIHRGVEYGHILWCPYIGGVKLPLFRKIEHWADTTNYTTTYEQPNYSFIASAIINIYNIQEFLRVYAQATRPVSSGTATALKCSWASFCWSWCVCNESYHLMQTFHYPPVSTYDITLHHEH